MNPFSNSLVLLIVAIGVTLPLQFPSLGPSWLAPVALGIAALALFLHMLARRFKLMTPADIPLWIIIAILPINLWASPDFAGSMARTYSFLGAIVVFWAVAAQHEQIGLLKVVEWLFLLAGLGLAILIFIWTPFTFPGARAIQAPIVARIPGGGSTPWGTQLNTNLSAGVIVLFWAPALAILVFGRNLLKRFLALPLIFGIPLILILGQSRGALFGVAAAFIAMFIVVLRKRPIVIVTVFALAAAVIYFGDVVQRLRPTDSAAVSQAVNSLEGRMELWSRAQYLLQDFPFTGVGLNRVEPTVHLLYPLFRIAPDAEFSHFHNLFLQTGAESGIPALIAHIAFYLILLFFLLRGAMRQNGRNQVIALGLFGTLVSFLTHNLVDDVIFFPRAALIIWAIFGYMMAVSLANNPADTQTS